VSCVLCFARTLCGGAPHRSSLKGGWATEAICAQETHGATEALQTRRWRSEARRGTHWRGGAREALAQGLSGAYTTVFLRYAKA
jgi:hypothetical protein